ncbi:efflux RND transporter periplasmic adaptor subunit [Undibacterium sp.]|jgi:HlyD family secretion protein|uniref:efflux RND transporter periplasmic adaptor subunit n=1 Tax=Undibacterium sp. TaxID=1914977 RepID=UPI002C134D52|nr:efflux RND transporter periplasmic adaptor subunit [Undibacterium sp.]HTD03671.1 efflux RND transporter periplasmic adaptor subunit [Undibacterium sp.]
MIRDTSAQDSVIATPQGWRTRKFAIWGGLAVAGVVAGVLLLSAWRGSSQSVSMARLSVAQVSRGTLVRDASVNGRMVAAISPTLYSTAPSTVTLKVKAGDTVKRGDIVAELESPDLTNELKREQASYEQLEAEVARQRILARKQKLLARRDADQAEIERVSAERTYQRIEAAGQVGVVAKIDFLKAQDALKSAEIRSRHAELATGLENEDVDLALKTKISQLQQQRLTRDNAQRRVDELKLRAPVDGFVGTLSVANRSVVAANTALMTLVDLSQLEVELEIPETYVADLGLGMNAEITINGVKAVGKLSALSPEVVKNIVLARVRFSGEQPPGLRQSQRVSARLLIEERPNVLMLPRGPFVENEGGRFAYVLENGVARRKPIRMGATSVTAVEILEGLKEGDKVVIAGTDNFENAASVSINN